MNANEHEWAKENIEVQLADGLNDVERARMARHLESCAECRASLDAAVAFDASVRDRLAADRPGPDLEDRVVRAIRPSLRPSRFAGPGTRLGLRILSLAAAVLVMFSLGSYVAAQVDPATYGGGMVALRLSHAAPEARAPGAEWKARSETQDSLGEEVEPARLYDAATGGGVPSSGFAIDTIVPGPDGQPTSDYASNVRSDWSRLQEQYGNAAPAARSESESDGFSFGRGGPAGEELARHGGRYREVSEQQQRAAAVWEQAPPAAAAAPNPPPAPGIVPPGEMGGGGSSPSGGDIADPHFRLIHLMEQNRREMLRNDVERQEERMELRSAEAATERSDAPGRPDATADAEEDRSGRRGRDRQNADRNRPAGAGETPPAPPTGARLIRTGEMEFEVDGFDSALLTVARVAVEEQGFIASTDSEKLPNGKVRGSIVVRCPPERLDTLVLKLRALGELKSQRIVSQDVTRQWTDFDSQLRAARAMEGRLLEIIRTGRGSIEELLAVEKELGTWRTRIEQLQGELNVLNDRIGLSTLSLTLAERDIRQPHRAVRREIGTASLEADDVEDAYRTILETVGQNEGRILDSQLQRHDAGQFTARIQYEVAPDRFETVLARVRQFGRVVNLDVRREEVLDGTPPPAGTPSRPTEIQQEPSRMTLAIYNLVNIAPRRTTQFTLAATDVERAYRAVQGIATDAEGRVVRANLDRSTPEQTRGVVQVEVPAAGAAAALDEMRSLGEVVGLAAVENPDTQNTTAAKEGFGLTIVSAASVPPRRAVQALLIAVDAEAAHASLLEKVREADGRIVSAAVHRGQGRPASTSLAVEIPTAQEAAFLGAIASLGEVLDRQTREVPGQQNATDAKVGIQVQVQALASVEPRQTINLQFASERVEEAYRDLVRFAEEAKGRILQSTLDKQDETHIRGVLVFDLPSDRRDPFEERLSALGHAVSRNVARADDNALCVDSKFRVAMQMFDLSQMDPRETAQVGLEVSDVESVRADLLRIVAEAGGRVVDSDLARDPSGKVVANARCDVPMSVYAAVMNQVQGLGEVQSLQVAKNHEVPDSPVARARLVLTLSNRDLIVPADGGIWSRIRKDLAVSFSVVSRGLGIIVIGLATVVPVALGLAILWALWRLVRRGRGSAA